MGSPLTLPSRDHTHTYTLNKVMKLASFIGILPLALGEVVQLNSENFDLTEAADLTLVKFFAPWCGHCQAMAEDWEEASKRVGEQIMIAEVDCTQELGADLCEKFDVGGDPTLMSFKAGKKHEEFYDRSVPAILKYVEKNGGKADSADIDTKFNGKSEEAPESYEDGTIWKVVGSNFEDVVFDDSKHVFLKIYAPWCGHCKNMQPAWESLAGAMKGREDVVIAEIDATANDLPSNYQVRGYPTIFWAAKDGKDEPVKYQGARTAEAWSKFIEEKTADDEVARDEL